MKKFFLCGLLLAGIASNCNAQWLRVWQSGESTRYALSEVASIPYVTSGSTISLGADSYSTSEIDSITIVNPVTISWTASGASVVIPESVEGVTAEVSGGDVVITNTNTWSEQEFILSGTSSAGSFTYNGDFKAKFHLHGLSLTSTSGAAIDIECGKRIDLILKDGSTNTFADAATGEQKAAFYCRGHMEVSGSGSLTVSGNSKHALATKEYLFLKQSVGTITIAKAASDGIHCGEYFLMNGGDIVLNNIGGDGLQVETDSDSDEELNGHFIMNGGSINLTVTAQDTKGIRLDDDATETAAATVIPEMYINDGTITVTITTTAKGARAIASDGNMTIGTATTSPVLNLTAGATRYKDSAGETTRTTGLKVEKDLVIMGGTTTIKATGNKSRGVRAGTLTAKGGTMKIEASGTDAEGYKLDDDADSVQDGGTIVITY